MIESLNVTNKNRDPLEYRWATEVPFLKNGPIKFEPGLNIIFGPNGSGKSTVAGILAFHLAAEQGGVSTVTSTWVRALFDYKGNSRANWDVTHDGRAVMYVNPRKSVGLSGGGFDDDFFLEGVGNALSKESTGQGTLRKLEHLIKLIMKDGEIETPKNNVGTTSDKKTAKVGKGRTARSFERESPKKSETELLGPSAVFPDSIKWPQPMRDELKISVQTHLTGSIPQGQRTIILDEPETGLSLPFQAGFWRNVMASKKAAGFQIIVATHSPFALNIEGANYIETSPGYLDTCRTLFNF